MAVAKKIDTLIPKVKREVPNCPRAVMLDEIRNTLIDFCINTDIYVQDLTPLLTVQNVNQYEADCLDIPVGAELNHILDIFRSSSPSTTALSKKSLTPLEAKSQIGSVSIFNFYGTGRIKYYTQKDQETILFAPTPEENETLYVLYSLKPTHTATTVPSIIINEYK